MDSYLSAFLLQIVLLSIFFIVLQLSFAKKLIANKHWYIAFLLVTVTAQIFTSALLQKEVGDVMLFSGAGYHYRFNLDFYFIDQGHTQYPFFPFLIFLHAWLNTLSELWPFLTFSFFLKLVLMIALYGISEVIRRNHSNKIQARVLQLQFLTHPITTMVVFFHGQVDVILLFFLIIAIPLLLSKNDNWLKWLLGVTFYTASIASKTWSIIFLPWLLWEEKNWLKRFLLPLLIAGGLLFDVFVYTRTVFGSSISTVLPAVLKPGGPVGDWGISYILSPFSVQLQQYNLMIFAALFGILAILVVLQKKDIWLIILLLLLSVYIVIPNWGIQYLSWIIPFVYLTHLTKSKYFWLYTVFGTLFAFFGYLNTINPSNVPVLYFKLAGFATWCIVIAWWWELFCTKDTVKQVKLSDGSN